jgi:soluble lytic murein transglycosylase-like protein
MAYQIYTPMQAPTIPTSIFSSAMERGAKMGTIIDSPETAKLKGQILGKEKALAQDQARANIELTQERIETANITQERQQEALEADKRANKLAPIKEGINIASGVLGVVSGIQGIQENSLDLELKQNRVELDNIKRDTQLKTESIKIDTAHLGAQNDNAVATREAADLKITKNIAKARSTGDTNQLFQVTQSPEFQSWAMRNPEEGLGIYEDLHRSGKISTAERDAKRSTFFSKKIMDSDLQVRRSESTVERKALEQYQKATQDVMTSLGPVIKANYPDANPFEADVYQHFEVIPDDLYKRSEDRTKIDRSQPPGTDINPKGEYLLIDKRDDRIVSTFAENGKEIQKQLENYKWTLAAWNNARQRDLRDGQLTEIDTPNGKQVIRKTEQEAPAAKVQDGGLNAYKKRVDAAKRKLELNRASPDIVEREAGEAKAAGRDIQSSGSAEGLVKKAVRKTAPFVSDNMSDRSFVDTATAARETAKETLKLYDTGSPKEKKAIKAYVKSIIPKSLLATRSADFLDKPSIKPDSLSPHTRLNKLTGIIRDDLVDTVEKIKQESLQRGISDTTPPPEQLQQLEDKSISAAASKAASPADAVRAARDVEKVRAGKARPDSVGSGTGQAAAGGSLPTEEKVNQAVRGAAVRNNWSSSKALDVKRTVVNVESSPYLEGQPAYVKAIVAVESRGDPDAVSPTGAIGLGQLTPPAMTDVNRNRKDILNRHIPEHNVIATRSYIEGLLVKYNYNKEFAYGAYNVGMGIVDDAIKLSGGKDTWDEIVPYLQPALEARYIAGKTAKTPFNAFREVRPYPRAVLDHEIIFSQLS